MVIWTQGCTKGCKGCFNPETWSSSGGEIVSGKDLAFRVFEENPYGLTISGGDPLEQPEGLLSFLQELHFDNEDLENFLPGGIIVFTGYRLEEIIAPAALSCLRYIDLLIDGRYVESLRYTSGLAGSSNQRFHFSNAHGRGKARVREDTIATDQHVEVHVDANGVIEVTGFPLINRSVLKKLGLRVIG